MNVSGSFPTSAPVAALRSLSSSPDVLERVSTLTAVHAGDDGVLHAVFAPVVVMGRIPLRTTIRTVFADDSGARLQVVGRRGVQSVDVALDIAFAAVADGTEVSWSADVVVRGNAASVGQRVAGDIATRAIGSVLAEAAAAAAGTPVSTAPAP